MLSELAEPHDERRDPRGPEEHTKAEPIESLAALFAEIEESVHQRRADFQDLLDRYSNTRLACGAELCEFRVLFKRISERLGVRPTLSDGRPASLQTRVKDSGNVYAALVARGRFEACGSPANSIPALTLSPLP